jgi:hypothetical protein
MNTLSLKGAPLAAMNRRAANLTTFARARSHRRLTKPHSMVKCCPIEAVMQSQFSTFALYTFYFYRQARGSNRHAYD